MRRPGTVLVRLTACAVLAAVGFAPSMLGAGAGPATAAATAAATATATATTEAADNSLLLLLDASGSMQESAGGGQTRIAAAKRALNGLVRELPATSNVGLRVYGATQDSGCDDTTLVSPVQPLDRPALRQQIRRFQPRGDTPIGRSLRAAANDLEGAPGRKTIVLVSDGEDTCTPPAPCEVARELAQQGLDLRVEAIGFQVGAEARRQLACIAKVTGGSYYDAPDSRALTGQLQALSLRAFRDFVPVGTPITGTPDAASAPEMTPGAWVDELAPGESRSYALEVTDGAVPVVNAALIAGATQPRLAGPENFVVTLNDVDGSECARGGASQTSRSFTASATAEGARATQGGATACEQPGPRILTVQRQFDSGQGVNTVEILFSQIGEPSPDAEPAAPVEPGPAGGPEGDPVATRGGTSYGDAPILGAGSWSDTLRTSETLYYRVPVGWGQALSANVRFSLLTPGEGAAGRMLPVVEVHDALRADPLNREITDLGGSVTRNVAITTPAVEGPTQATDPVLPFRIAGQEYLVVNGSDIIGDADVAAASLRIDLAVDGEQVEGPRLAVVGAPTSPSPTPEQEESTPAPTDQGAPDDGSDSGGLPTWLLVVGGLALLAVVAALAVTSRRRSSSS